MEGNKRINDLRVAYRQLNESFKPVLIFHIGASAGFFSEYNCMILAMLYCIQHRIQFKLYSADANFGYEKGWADFFEPFCEEERAAWHHKFNMRPCGSWRVILRTKNFRLFKWKIKRTIYDGLMKLWRCFHPNLFLTQDIWKKALSREALSRVYDIPALGVHGDVVEACHVLVEITWRFRADIRKQIYNYIDARCNYSTFLSCQIRAGDKYIECNLLPVETYVEKLADYLEIKDVFVLTDDYAVMRQLQARFPYWHWHTFCEEVENGYVHTEFKTRSKEMKRKQLLRFFASIEMIHLSDRFIGTITSNPSIFSFFRHPEKTVFVERNADPFRLFGE